MALTAKRRHLPKLELMALLDLSHRATFQKNYLTPVVEAGVVERILSDKP